MFYQARSALGQTGQEVASAVIVKALQVCQADAQRMCPARLNQAQNHFAMLNCLKAHQAMLSSQCSQMMARLQSMPAGLRQPVQMPGPPQGQLPGWIPSLPPGGLPGLPEAGLADTLTGHRHKTVLVACKAELTRFRECQQVGNQAWQFRGTMPAKVMELKRRQCLKEHKDELSEECAAEVTPSEASSPSRPSAMAEFDKKMRPRLPKTAKFEHKARIAAKWLPMCENERATFCEGQVGRGALLECLWRARRAPTFGLQCTAALLTDETQEHIHEPHANLLLQKKCAAAIDEFCQDEKEKFASATSHVAHVRAVLGKKNTTEGTTMPQGAIMDCLSSHHGDLIIHRPECMRELMKQASVEAVKTEMHSEMVFYHRVIGRCGADVNMFCQEYPKKELVSIYRCLTEHAVEESMTESCAMVLNENATWHVETRGTPWNLPEAFNMTKSLELEVAASGELPPGLDQSSERWGPMMTASFASSGSMGCVCMLTLYALRRAWVASCKTAKSN